MIYGRPSVIQPLLVHTIVYLKLEVTRIFKCICSIKKNVLYNSSTLLGFRLQKVHWFFCLKIGMAIVCLNLLLNGN